MNIFTIPARNMRRKPSKSLLLLAVFSLGVMSVVALYQVSRVVGESLERKLTAFGANIVISPATDKLSVSYGGFNMGEMFIDIEELPEEKTVAAIHSIALNNRISAVAPKLVAMARIDDAAVAVVGVRWPDERRLKSYLAVNGRFPQTPDEVVPGDRVASILGLVEGSQVTILGKRFTVSGVLHATGSDDDTVILMDLGTLQNLVEKPGATSFIEVAALCFGCPIDDIVAQIKDTLPKAEVKALQNIVDQRMASVHFVQKLALSISLVILLTAGTMVGLSMLSAVNERKKEIGVLRSLGYSKGQVFSIFCLEACFIGVVSGIGGYLGGYLASFKILQILVIAEGAVPVFSFIHLFMAAVVFALLAGFAALYPSWKGARIEPSAALVAL